MAVFYACSIAKGWLNLLSYNKQRHLGMTIRTHERFWAAPLSLLFVFSRKIKLKK